jgi:hypothetical protein
VAGVNAVTSGLLADCTTQNAMTGNAENEAAFNNTLALYNLKFRFQVEQNMLATTNPVALFELPASQGGYLEYVRAIVADSMAKGQSLIPALSYSAAVAALAQGDNYYAANSFKLAYGSYRKAYTAVAQ